jgi:hypothetical protein
VKFNKRAYGKGLLFLMSLIVGILIKELFDPTLVEMAAIVAVVGLVAAIVDRRFAKDV